MKRLRVVLDTNVLISAILFGGPPRQVLEKVIAGELECSLSLALLDELRDVLRRPKFGFSARMALTIIEELSAICQIVSPTQELEIVEADPDDDRVLECALETKADFIVSGDAHLLDLGFYGDIRIVSSSDLLAYLEKQSRSRRRRQRQRRNGGASGDAEA